MLYECSNNAFAKIMFRINVYYRITNIVSFKRLSCKLLSVKKYKYAYHANLFIGFVNLISQNRNMIIVKKSNLISVERFFSLSNYIHMKTKNTFLNCDKYQFGLIHRIDRLSTGMLIVGKNLTFLKRKQSCFHKRIIFKRYSTLCSNRILYTFKTLINNSTTLIKRITFGNYKICFSKYYEIMQSNDIVYSSVDIITGRKHQIRRNMKNLGASIINDSLYSVDRRQVYFKNCSIYNFISEYNNAFLHAEQLAFYCMYFNRLSLRRTSKLDSFTNAVGLL
jgi:23S rRNA-/tRNA-specific pseudouridylate synthase